MGNTKLICFQKPLSYTKKVFSNGCFFKKSMFSKKVFYHVKFPYQEMFSPFFLKMQKISCKDKVFLPH